jgi:hypothetical protein
MRTQAWTRSAGHRATLREGLEEEAAVMIVAIDGFPPIPARHDMVEGAGNLDANAAWHCASLSAGVSFVKKCCLTPAMKPIFAREKIVPERIGKMRY